MILFDILIVKLEAVMPVSSLVLCSSVCIFIFVALALSLYEINVRRVCSNVSRCAG